MKSSQSPQGACGQVQGGAAGRAVPAGTPAAHPSAARTPAGTEPTPALLTSLQLYSGSTSITLKERNNKQGEKKRKTKKWGIKREKILP